MQFVSIDHIDILFAIKLAEKTLIHNMGIIEKVSISFFAYKPVFHIFSIFDLKNFQNQEWRSLTRNICKAMIFSIIILAFIVALLTDSWYCMDHNFNVVDFALAFGVLINSSQLAITYISIQMKINLVDEVIDALEKVLIKRKCSSPLIFIDEYFSTDVGIFPTGCELASKRIAHYELLEKRFTVYISVAAKMLIGINLLCCAVTFLIPVSYTIFGYPQPDQWFRLYQFK